MAVLKQGVFKICQLSFFLIPLAVGIKAQQATDPHLVLVREGIEYIYNQNFTKGEEVIAKLEKTMPGNAIPDLMKALLLYWKYDPIYLKEDKLHQYQSYLDQSFTRSEKVLQSDPGNPEAIFLAMACQGLLAESYAESGRSFKAIGAAKRAYNYIKIGSGMMGQLTEFYLSTGLYNYYREYYPETYPIYRPFMSFFMKGDKELGIEQLEIAAKNASIAHVIAKYYLCYIYMRYEYIPGKALRQARNLHESYPNNPTFMAIYLESLIINDRFQEALPLANKLKSHTSPYLKIYGDLFLGVIQEKHYKDHPQAEMLYKSALKLNEQYKMERAHLEAFAYLGLGRIYESKNAPEARKYFKEALDQAFTKTMKEEARSHLN